MNQEINNEMDNQFRFLDKDEVVEVDEENQDQIPGVTGLTFRGLHLYNGLKTHYGLEAVLDEGITCQILSPRQPWQKGKIKLAVIFYPDEVESDRTSNSPLDQESPLDDIRQSIA